MANNRINEYLKFANLQMASESFLNRIRDRDFGRDNSSVLVDNLAGFTNTDGVFVPATIKGARLD